MNSKKIAIRYNKKNICRLPVIPENGMKKIDIIAGINYIDAEGWNHMKQHSCIQYKLEKGIIEEILSSKIQIKPKISKQEEKKQEENIVSMDIIEKEIKRLSEEFKNEKDKDKKESLKKDLNEFKKQLDLLKQKEVKKVEINITDFNQLKVSQKEEIIKETFNIDTLKDFAENEEDGAIRLKIEKRIDYIKNAKTDETIDHPKGHQKK